MLIPPFKMKNVYLFIFSFLVSSTAIAQKSSEFSANDSAVAIRDLGFQAKLMHLTANPSVAVVEEPVKKSTRSLADILAKNEKKLKQKQFHLIAGCFSSASNANKLSDRLISEGYQASVFQEEGRGLFFVAYESFDEEHEATTALAALKKKGLETWLSTY